MRRAQLVAAHIGKGESGPYDLSQQWNRSALALGAESPEVMGRTLAAMTEPTGVQHGKVELVRHHPAWASMYRAEADRIVGSCGKLVLAIEHIGSTSIPDICAKPIIDLAMGVAVLEDADKMESGMLSIGYDYPRDVGIPDEYVFGRGNPNRLYIAHVQVHDSDHWNDYLEFRNRLRENRQLAKEYEALKLSLADEFQNDRATYGGRKAEFVAHVLGRQFT